METFKREKTRLIVEFELDESWEAYFPDDEQKVQALIRPQLEGVTVKHIERLSNELPYD